MMMVFEPMSVIYKFVTLFFVVCLLVLFTATMSEEAIRMTVCVYKWSQCTETLMYLFVDMH